MAEVNAAEVTCRMLRAVNWVRDGGYPVQLARDKTYQIPRATAANWYLSGLAVPLGKLTAGELREAAGPAFEGIEEERRRRGLSEALAMNVPALRRKYQELASLIGQAGGDGPEAA